MNPRYCREKLTSAAASGLRRRRTQKRYMRACIFFRATGLPPYEYVLKDMETALFTIFQTGGQTEPPKGPPCKEQ